MPWRSRTSFRWTSDRTVRSTPFDEYVWFDETRAVTPLRRTPLEEGAPETFPFGV